MLETTSDPSLLRLFHGPVWCLLHPRMKRFPASRRRPRPQPVCFSFMEVTDYVETYPEPAHHHPSLHTRAWLCPAIAVSSSNNTRRRCHLPSKVRQVAYRKHEGLDLRCRDAPARSCLCTGTQGSHRILQWLKAEPPPGGQSFPQET